MSKTSHTAFFGDAEHVFDLAKPEIVRELEAVTGAGIGALVARVGTQNFKHADLEHTIRLGLVGGGMDPERAARLVGAYLPARPLVAAMILAVSILGCLFHGSSREEVPPVPTSEPQAEEPAQDQPPAEALEERNNAAWAAMLARKP